MCVRVCVCVCVCASVCMGILSVSAFGTNVQVCASCVNMKFFGSVHAIAMLYIIVCMCAFPRTV